MLFVENLTEPPPKSLQPESRVKRRKGEEMDNADKKARETAEFLNNLTEFLSSDEREVEEIRDSLRAQGIDPDESLKRFHQILSEHAPTWQEKAARARAALTASVETHAVRIRRARADIERDIRELVESMQTLGAPVQAGAYHRKFQEARDEDLESLLADLRFQRELLAKRQEKKGDSNG
jgi:hypothetical protein